MDDKRKGEIAYILLKLHIQQTFRNIDNLKRNIGNISKETNIPKDELIEFSKPIIKEVFGELLGNM